MHASDCIYALSEATERKLKVYTCFFLILLQLIILLLLFLFNVLHVPVYIKNYYK